MRIASILLVLWLAPKVSVAQEQVDISALLAEMSLEEKVGQMCQIDLGVIAKGDICNLKIPQELDAAKLRLALEKYQVGSILNVGCGAGAIELANWRKILSQIETANNKYQKHQIPIIFGIDAIHGAGYTNGSVMLPQQIAQAATWNPALVQKGYEMTAYETRATGIPWNFSPVLDLGRQPLWSRFFETFGEDVFLAEAMTTSAIKGLQGKDPSSPYSLAACMKHFLGYSHPLSGKDRTPVWMGERTLREYYLPTFREAINSGALTVMINSGEIDGIPVHDDPKILTELLRDELGFEGIAVTDWEDIWKLVNVHHVAKDKKEAVKKAIMAGIDMSMVPNDMEFCDLLVELVKEGEVPMSRIDESVERILRVKKQLGLFENFTYPLIKYPKFGSEEHEGISYQVAAESITMLKNSNDILPIKAGASVFVCGPGAMNKNTLLGSWSRTWQGNEDLKDEDMLTIAESIAEHGFDSHHLPGSTYDSLVDIAACEKAAAAKDVIIICLAEKPSTEIPGNIESLELPEAQKELVRRMKKLGKKIILVCSFNRPRIIHDEVAMADAVVYTYYPGPQGAWALGEILTGKLNPSGKLPFTYPASSASVVHYDRKHSEDLDVDFSTNAYRPEFDFGFGLSYSKFEYIDMKLSSDSAPRDGIIEVEVKVRNTSNKAGQEVVQLYVSDLVASVTPAVKRLCGFQKVNLEPNQLKTVKIRLPMEELSLIDRDMRRVVEEGEFVLKINNLEKKLYVN